uniref:Uncharacterized protein n=1 Tax=Anguilla anguilla TaxID=7936 RepID=A0A0E9SNP9_ANGAN
MFLTGRVTHPILNPTEHMHHLLKTGTEGETLQNKQELKLAVVQACRSVTWEFTQHMVIAMVTDFR